MSQESYSTEEIAKLLGVSTKVARNLLREGDLECSQHRLTGRWMIDRETIDHYLDELKRRQAESESKDHRVLIVDDDKNVVNMIRSILMRSLSNLNIETCSDGYEALVSIGKLPPDLLILDNRMPKTMGKNVLHAIRKNPKTKGVRVLVVAGHPEDIQEMQALGADATLEKPFSTQMLVVKAKQLIFQSPEALLIQ